jgi:aminoglycoside phosphotransferase (APT) family kinase protein
VTTTGGRRDTRALASGIEAWLRSTRPAEAARVLDVAHPGAGMSNDTVIVTTAGCEGPPAVEEQTFVIRLPPLVPTFPDLDLGLQAELHGVLSGGGVPAPEPVIYEPDPTWLGDPFLVLPFVAGHVPGQAPPFDPWITDATHEQQRAIEDAFLQTMATLHHLDWRGSKISTVLRGAGTSMREEVAWWVAYVDWATDGPPLTRLVDLLGWCDEHCPAAEPVPSLLWGDARLGNTIFGPDRQLLAALDWETASVGPAEADLAWYLGLDAALRHFAAGAAVPGFRDHDGVVERYEALLGRAVVDLAWHEIFAVARSICITYRQARIAAASGTKAAMPGDEHHPMFPMVERWIEAWQPGSCEEPIIG